MDRATYEQRKRDAQADADRALAAGDIPAFRTAIRRAGDITAEFIEHEMNAPGLFRRNEA